MSRRRHTPERVVRKPRETGRLLSERSELPEALKHLEIAEATYHRWRNQYVGMKAADVKRLKELEAENQQPKRIVADHALDIQGLKELSAGRMKVKSSLHQRLVLEVPVSTAETSFLHLARATTRFPRRPTLRRVTRVVSSGRQECSSMPAANS